MGQDKPTFYLYGQGEPEDIICLGNLVLKDPRNPRVPGYFWTADVLNDNEHRTLAYSVPIDGEFSTKRGVNLGVVVEAADLINLDTSLIRAYGRLVVARAGQRVVLKDPQAFLNQKILPQKAAQEQLRLWLATGNALKRRFKPKIWMCTGLYVLTDASMHEVQSTQATLSPSINSVTMASICGIPVGGSIQIGPSKELVNKFTAHGTLVWAAQYRLLDLRYIDKRESGSVEALPNTIRLLPDIIGGATLRGEDVDFIQITIPETTGYAPDLEEAVVTTETDLDEGDSVEWSQFDQIQRELCEFFAE